MVDEQPVAVVDGEVREVTYDDILSTLRPVIEELRDLSDVLYGTELGYLVISLHSDRTITMFQALNNARKQLQVVRDSVKRRAAVAEGR